MRPVVMLCTAILAFALAPGARADGLVQITFEGQIQPPGGALVEVAVDARVDDGLQRREVRARLHLAYGTTAEELAVRQKMFAKFLKTNMAPAELADITFEGIRAKRLYILTHPQFNDVILERAKNITDGANPSPLDVTAI